MAYDFPASPSNGQTVTGASGAVYTFDGTKWRAGGTSSRASLTIGDTSPVSPMAGELWWDSTGGQLFVRYADPNTSQWVLANSGPIASDAPSDARTYARSNAAWTDITATAAASPNNVGRNLLHNPLMAVAQRGVGPFTANGYTLDRWKLGFGSDTDSVQRIALGDADRAAIGDEAATYALQNTFTGNAAAGAYSFLVQCIEDVRRLAGKTVTVSFWANASAALKLGASIDQFFGSGGSPSAQVNGNGTAVTLTTAEQRYSVTIVIPSIAGKTLGTNGDSWTQVNFWFSCGATNAVRAGSIGIQSGTINLWGVQLEIGSVATPLDYGGSYGDQLRACQRYYQTGTVGWWGYGGAAATIGSFVQFPVQMRATPTVGFSGAGYGNASGAAPAMASGSSFAAQATATATGVAAFTANYTASADL